LRRTKEEKKRKKTLAPVYGIKRGKGRERPTPLDLSRAWGKKKREKDEPLPVAAARTKTAASFIPGRREEKEQSV